MASKFQFSRPVPVWSMEPAYTGPVIETLEATFGTLAEKDTLPDAVRSASRNAVADHFQDYLRDLRDCRGGSMLEELDELISVDALTADTPDITITLCNNAGFVLPFTGGRGFAAPILFVALMLDMGVYFCKKSEFKKKNN